MAVKTGFRQTEVGVIPTDWDTASLVEICAQNGIVRGPFGGALKKEFFVKDGFKVYEQKNAIYRDADLGSYFIDANKYQELHRFQVKEGDFIVSCSGTIGRIFRIPGKAREGVINQALLKITSNPKIIHPGFFFYYFDWDRFQEKIIDNTHGGAMQNLVGMEIFKNILFPLPSLPEQHAIATALSDIDTTLGALDRLIAKKRALKQGAMQELLAGKRRLPGFSGEWVVRRLADVADVIDPHPSHRAPGEVSNGVPFVGIGDLDEAGNIVGNKVRLVSPTVLDEHALRYDLRGELIGLGRVASIGKVVALKVLGEGYAISPTLGVIRGHKARRSYLVHALKSRFVTEQFTKVMSGSTRSSVGMEVLRELHVRLPPSGNEQTAIAAVLSDMDAEIAALERQRNKTKALKQGMMQELLTGKTRLI